MRSRSVTVLLMCVVALFFVTSGALAQGHFVRAGEIPVPETDLNTDGTGNMIAGVDFDNDGKTEIYLVNDMWTTGSTGEVPRIYKLEKEGSEWKVVWKAGAPVEKQNTWPFLTHGDLDKDGKEEVYWGIVNNISATTVLNPYRILVYEVKGDGSDVLGVDDGVGGYLPNAKWTISAADNDNIRPIQACIADPDKDGIDELLFADRAGRTGGVFCGVVSVDKIPDNGDGTETWTMETSGLDFTLKAGTTQNKWDVVSIGSNVYSFCEIEITKFTWDGFGWGYTRLSPMAGGAPVQSTQVVDLDGDGAKEMIVAIYDWGNDAAKGIYLVQEEGDSLKKTELVNTGKYFPGGSRGLWGGASGDIDGDGKLDFVYGARAGSPNAGIYRLAYKGGDITNPANYSFTVIDSLYSEGGIYNVINLANIDDDPQLEVLYTSSTDAGVLPDVGTKPIVVLDYVPETPTFDNLVIAPEVLFDGAVPPTDFLFRPGRILDNGKTIWMGTYNSTSKETWVYRSIDGGKTFTHNPTAIPSRAAQVDAFDANTAVIALENGKIFRTTDGGQTWTEVYSYLLNPILGGDGFFDGIRVLDENTAVAIGDGENDGDMHIARSTDKGATWTQITGVDFKGAAYAYFSWGLASFNLGETMWVAAYSSSGYGAFILRTYDAGLTWESFAIPTDLVPRHARAITFVNQTDGMIAARGGFVIKTTDGGATWTQASNPDTSADSYVNGVVAIPGTNIILGMDDIGVFATTDLGTTWTKLNTPPELDGSVDDYISGLFLNPDFGYVFTYNGQVLRFQNMLTGVADRPAGNVPASFQLARNYPNPFNPTTTISYTLPARQNVSLVIYNLKGEVVKSLVDGTMSEGTHAVQWDATNQLGQKVTSGIYIYLLRSNGQMIARQMVLVK